MEGLIPFVYRAVVEYRNGGGGEAASNMGSSWYSSESPSTSNYMRLGSGRFQNTTTQVSSNPMVVITATSTLQSPLVCRSTSRRIVSS
ncbi:hypothetical protein MKX01_016925 [Papaver californicum]|nr:hypothetical protein MKX01_016925 [Papaver californicum]